MRAARRKADGRSKSVLHVRKRRVRESHSMYQAGEKVNGKDHHQASSASF